MNIDDLIAQLQKIRKSHKNLNILVNNNLYISEVKPYKVFYNNEYHNTLLYKRKIVYSEDYPLNSEITDDYGITYKVIEMLFITA